jgi:hypothetical protein
MLFINHILNLNSNTIVHRLTKDSQHELPVKHNVQIIWPHGSEGRRAGGREEEVKMGAVLNVNKTVLFTAFKHIYEILNIIQ